MTICNRKPVWLWLVILLGLALSPMVIANEYLSETKEVVFDAELIKLAEDLEHDPVKIYDWVYENIEFENYDYARKNALNVYWTRRGNEWDQSTLLITLMRLANIQARYAIYNDAEDDGYYGKRPFVEVLLPIENYRGNGNDEGKTWIPLVPWKKEYKTTLGLDLFPNNEIPAELNFNFDDYVKTIKQKTALELYEEQLQDYLDIHHPGKTLNDIGYQQTIIKRSASILPLSLPQYSITVGEEAVIEGFSSIPNEYKYKVTYYIKRYSDEVKVLEYDIYIPEISTSRVVLDFLPYDQTNANKIAPYGLITKTPDGAAQVKAVLKVDGNIVASSSTFTTGDYFFDGNDIYGLVDDRGRKKVGTTLSLSFDALISSEKIIENLKRELSGVSLDSLNNDYTKEEYLGRYLSIIAHDYNYRHNAHRKKIDSYFFIRRNYIDNIWFGRTYTFATDINTSDKENFSISNSMKFDYSVAYGTPIYKFTTDEYIGFQSDINKLVASLGGYTGSYNEGLIFEDWQSTPGASTVKAFMVANAQNVPIVTLTKYDVVNGHIPILENQTYNRYGDSAIQSIISELLADNSQRLRETVTIPVRKLDYEGATLQGWLSPTAYLFAIDNGALNNGGGSVATTEPVVVTNVSVDSSQSTINESFTSTNTSSSSGSGSGSGSTQNNTIAFDYNNFSIYREPSYDGDPVDMLTGEFYQEEVADIELKSVVNNLLSVQRTYKSRLDYNGIFGYGWAWNHMERIIPSNGNTLLYVDENAKFSTITQHSNTSFTYPNGASYTLVFANNSYTLTEKNGAKKVFDNNGLLKEKIDTNGNTLYFDYNAQHNISAISDGQGKTLTFTYNSNNKVTAVTDGQGFTTNYSYDDDDLIAYSDGEGNTTQYEYLKNQENPANNHNMSKYILPNGDYLELVYYKNDQVSHHTNKNGDTFNFQYSRYNQYAETWNEAGYYRKVFFNDYGDVIRIDKKDGTIEQKEYDSNHNLIAHTDGNGNRSTFTYDAKRNLLSKTNALNETTTYEYHPNFNKLTKETDPNGNVTNYAYDNKGNLTQVVNALGQVTAYEYDNVGNLTKTIDALGHEIINTYDNTGTYRISQTDKRGNTTQYTYDTAGNVTSMTNALGDVEYTQYDKNNQLLEHTDANGDRTQYSYNTNKKLTQKTLANGAVYTYTYHDAKDIVIGNLLKEEIDPLGHSTQYAYDKLGNRTQVTDKNGHVTRTTYNGLQQITSTQTANGYITYYHYDGLGNLVKEVGSHREDFDTVDIITEYAYDVASRLIRKTLPNGHVINYTYDANGNQLTESYVITTGNTSETVTTRYDYDSLNQVIAITQGAGSASPRVTTMEYDALQRKIKETHSQGNAQAISTRWVYDANNNLLQEVVENAYQTNDLVRVSNQYNALNQRVQQTNANGHTTHYSYDAKGQLLSTTNALNHTVSYHYDSVGNRIREDRPTGDSLHYRYDANNQLTQRTNALGHNEYLSYDPNGNVISIRDANGNTRHTAYNSMNQPVAHTDSHGNISTLSYDERGNIIAQVNAAGNITEYQYDLNNNRQQQRQYLSSTDSVDTHYTYDALHRLTEMTDPNGHVTRYTYNIFNEQTAVTDALGHTTSQTYDTLGRVITFTDNNGISTHNQYDALGRVIQITQAVGTDAETITQLRYDPEGNRTHRIEGIISSNGNNGGNSENNDEHAITTHTTYDALNRVLTTAVNEQIVASQDYDALGNIISQTDGNGHTQYRRYNGNQQVIEHTDANGQTTHFAYDANGNLLSRISPEGVTTVYEYDALNRITTQQQGDSITNFAYDAASRLTSTLDGNGERHHQTYDPLGRVIQATTAQYSDSETTIHYAYDGNNNLTQVTQANGHTLTTTYDSLNRAITHTRPSGAAEHYQYDGNGNRTVTTQKDNTVVTTLYDALNRRTRVTVNGVEEQTYAYDALSRLTNSTDHNQGRQTHHVSYVYDHLNNITQTTQNGKVITTSYDANSNLIALNANGLSITNGYTTRNGLQNLTANTQTIADMVYDNDHRRSQITTANGITLALSYDSQSREKERAYTAQTLPDQPLFGQESDYDANNNVLEERITQQNQTLIKQYQYDAQNRLTNDNQNNHYFTYDNNGNITGTNHNGYVETRNISRDDQYTLILGGQSTAISYDANDNIAQYGFNTFSYDYNNRLIEAKHNGQVIASYTYDAENRRVSKTVNNTTTTYLYHHNQVVQEYTNNDTTANISYVYSDQLDDPIAFINNNQTYYYLKDRVGSIRAITDGNGQVVERYSYNAFGIMVISDSSGNVLTESAYGNSYTYTGRRYDPETGLYYYRNRMYSAELGRFMSEDPLGYVDGYNLYQYALNNPLRYTDPMGTTALDNNSGSSLYPNGANYPQASDPINISSSPAFDANERLGGVPINSCSSGNCSNFSSPLTGINRTSVNRSGQPIFNGDGVDDSDLRVSIGLQGTAKLGVSGLLGVSVTARAPLVETSLVTGNRYATEAYGIRVDIGKYSIGYEKQRSVPIGPNDVMAGLILRGVPFDGGVKLGSHGVDSSKFGQFSFGIGLIGAISANVDFADGTK